jgi:C2 domain-containing protein 3
MELKLWEKTNENTEKWIGLTKVPLHQFYIAFKDAVMIKHLSTNKLPIISIDAWCNFISPLSNELYCQAKVLLAIGNENQIDYLKLSRNFHNLPRPSQIQEHKCHQSNLDRSLQMNSQQANASNQQLKSKLSAFIESLSQKLPEPSAVQHSKHSSSSSSVSSQNLTTQRGNLRKTSDLLDTLQKALTQPPTESINLLSPFQRQEDETSSNSIMDDNLKMLINVEQALNLPKVVAKKCRNKRKNKPQNSQRVSEYEPVTYATFEAVTSHFSENSFPQNVIKSHEGIVYCTKSIQSCNPEWNEDFNVEISFDILRNPHKKFVVKVWRKASHEPAKMEPSPFEDCVVGFSAIDLSVLLTGLPILSGFYNIVDFSGRINGQLKISFKPLENVENFRSPESPLVPLMRPLNIDINTEPLDMVPGHGSIFNNIHFYVVFKKNYSLQMVQHYSVEH